MAAALVLAAFLTGCGENGGAPDEAPGADPPAADEGPPPGTLPQGVSAEVGATGRVVYRTACVMCHGEAAEGTQLGPSLVDTAWVQGTGAFQDIVRVVQEGVEEPQEFPVPMPPRGNGALTDDEVRAVSAYTFSLARRTGAAAADSAARP